MPIFYYHPLNSLSKKLIESTRERGFLYTNRSEMEFRIQQKIADLGYDIWPSFHTVLGSLGTPITQIIPLDPSDTLDSHTLRVCKLGGSWGFIKVVNGPQMQDVVGYCSSLSGQPYNMTNAELAQKGILSATYVPRGLQ